MKPRFTVITALLIIGSLAGCTTPSASPTTPAKAAPAHAKPTAKAATTTKATTAPQTTSEASKPTDTAPASTAEISLPDASAPVRKLSPEATALVARFTNGQGSNTVHELADTTGFPEAIASLQSGGSRPKIDPKEATNLPPAKGLTADGNSTELIERDWTGLVLVPVNTSLSKAYTSEVRLLKVEAHPLHDGRVRIWTRVQNQGNETLLSEVACQFRMRGETTPNSPYYYELELPPGAFRDVFFVSGDGEVAAYTVLIRSVGILKRRY